MEDIADIELYGKAKVEGEELDGNADKVEIEEPDHEPTDLDRPMLSVKLQIAFRMPFEGLIGTARDLLPSAKRKRISVMPEVAPAVNDPHNEIENDDTGQDDGQCVCQPRKSLRRSCPMRGSCRG